MILPRCGLLCRTSVTATRHLGAFISSGKPLPRKDQGLHCAAKTQQLPLSSYDRILRMRASEMSSRFKPEPCTSKRSTELPRTGIIQEAKKRSEKITPRSGLESRRSSRSRSERPTIKNISGRSSLMFSKSAFSLYPEREMQSTCQRTPHRSILRIRSTPDIGATMRRFTNHDSLCALSTQLQSGDVVEILPKKSEKFQRPLAQSPKPILRAKIKPQLRESLSCIPEADSRNNSFL